MQRAVATSGKSGDDAPNGTEPGPGDAVRKEQLDASDAEGAESDKR